MKKPSKQARKDFWYGFALAMMVMIATLICLGGMWIVEQNTRAIGFSQTDGS